MLKLCDAIIRLDALTVRPLIRVLGWLWYQAKLLPHRPRLWWHRAWIREDELHRSLDTDIRAVGCMNTEDRQRYSVDLMRRRNIAHKRDP